MILWHIGKVMVSMGLILIVTGLLVMGASRLSLPFGKLPGDIVIIRKNFTLFAPLGTMLLLSLVLSLLFNVISRFWSR